MTSFNVRSILTGIANLVAIFVVIGVVSQQFYGNKANNNSSSLSESVIDMDGLPVHRQLGKVDGLPVHRQLAKSSKGKSEAGCIPLYPTAAPTKGKGYDRRKLKKGKKNPPSAKYPKAPKAPKSTKSPTILESEAPVSWFDERNVSWPMNRATSLYSLQNAYASLPS